MSWDRLSDAMFDAKTYYGTEAMGRHIAYGSRERVDRLKFCLPDTWRGKRILDLGCGPGWQVRYLAKDNLVCGMDVGLPMVTQAKTWGLRPCLANAEQPHLPFQDEVFDAVVCTDVLEHLYAPQAALAEIRRVLKPDGLAVLAVPNHFTLQDRLRILAGGNLLHWWHRRTFKAWDFFHLHFWTLRDWYAFLEEGGFAVTNRYFDRDVMDLLHVAACLVDPEFLRDWHRRHRRQWAYRAVVTAASVFLRVTRLGRTLPKVLPQRFPALFSLVFLVEARKSGQAFRT